MGAGRGGGVGGLILFFFLGGEFLYISFNYFKSFRMWGVWENGGGPQIGLTREEVAPSTVSFFTFFLFFKTNRRLRRAPVAQLR